MPAAIQKLVSEPGMGSGLQTPILVTSAVSLHCPTADLLTGCIADQRAQEEEVDMWIQSIGKTGV